jgi:competence protein ComEA
MYGHINGTIAAVRGWLAERRVGLGLGLLGLSIVLIGVWLWRPPTAPVIVTVPTLAPSPTVQIMVHVVGEVREPGLYQFPMGARVVDAVDRAGGLTAAADANALNMAARLADGQRIAIPAQGLAAPSVSAGRLNLNRASRAELEGLPGIGAITAQRIVEHRDRNGPFQTLDQLRDLRILTAAITDRIRDLVVVE